MSQSPFQLHLDEDESEETFTLIGSGEYQIVGIRYYTGVAHPGEYIALIREPHNPYDRYAIRVDNLQGEKIGHIKATMARSLSQVMDNYHLHHVKLYGRIPRKGNAYTLPLFVEFYHTGVPEHAPNIAQSIHSILKHDYCFRLSREFGGTAMSFSHEITPNNVKVAATVSVTRSKLDWNQQQKELDDMFDKTLQDQYKNLPNIPMSPCFKKHTSLLEHQIQGIKWLYQREVGGKPAPFYKPIKEKGKTVYLCEITQSSQLNPPPPIQGGLLCDAMGLGKTLIAIGLILVAPPPGVVYKVPIHPQMQIQIQINDDTLNGNHLAKDDSRHSTDMEEETHKYIPIPGESVIRAANATTLKSILKAAQLKISGKKSDLLNRILENQGNKIRGEHFPISMQPQINHATTTSTTSCKCTLIVCPVSVMSNWIHQVKHHVEEGVLTLELYHGTNRQDLLHKINEIDILLVSYHTLAAEYGSAFGEEEEDAKQEEPTPKKKKCKKDTIFDIEFHRIVLDEAVSEPSCLCDIF